tara:strand:+ start:384 stop:827 length:444 start_codon:yes stop_codon:yes gene_type:complete
MSIASHHVVITAEYQHHIVITAEDHQRLLQLLQREFKEITGCTSHLYDMLKELHRASVVDPADVSRDVVTMDSVIELTDLDTNESEIFTLVYPDSENVKENMLSVFAPIGTAILGYHIGDFVSWAIPIGLRRMKIESILYQPEHYQK